MLCVSPTVWAQSRPEDGGNEFQIWTGGGHSVSGGTRDTSVWNAGVRYGWILTRPHGPAFLKGRFEYVLDAVPAFVHMQKYNTAYGAGVSPLGLKWDFAARGRVEPYLELNGGTLFTNHEVPTELLALTLRMRLPSDFTCLVTSGHGRWRRVTCTFRMRACLRQIQA